MPVPHSDAQRLHRVTLAVLAVVVTAVFLWMIHEFLIPLLLAALLTALFHPMYRRLAGPLKGRASMASALTVGLVSLLVILPVIGFFSIVTLQSIELSGLVGPWLQRHASETGDLGASLKETAAYRLLIPYQDELLKRAGSLAGQVGSYAASTITGIAQGAVSFLFMLFVMLYAMFFFLVDGRGVLAKMLYYLPLPPADENRMLEKFVSVTRATIKGTLVIGVIQGALAGIGFWVAGIPGALVWGTIMAVLSVVPGIGAPLVWVPAVAFLALTGAWAASFALFAWCAAVVGTVDNVLRPRLVGRDTKMPDLLILLSTLGGIVLFGATGIIIGPLIAALFLTVWDLYGIAFHDLLPKADGEAPCSVPEAHGATGAEQQA